MRIWVDADACPAGIKDLRSRAVDRWGMALMLVANQLRRLPPSPQIQALQVPVGFDIAAQTMAQHVPEGRLVVTTDIPRAAQVMAHGGQALNPRGTWYTRENIHEHPTMRQVLDERRQSGVHTGGPAPCSPRDRHAFAKPWHRVLTHDRKTASGPTPPLSPPITPPQPSGSSRPQVRWAHRCERGGWQDHPTAVPVVAVCVLTESTGLVADALVPSDLHPRWDGAPPG